MTFGGDWHLLAAKSEVAEKCQKNCFIRSDVDSISAMELLKRGACVCSVLKLHLSMRIFPSFSVGLLVALLVCLHAGCAKWSPRKSGEIKLPNHRMSSDAVALELALAQIGESKVSLLEDLWRRLDSQEISLESRKLLDQNGFRIAVIPAQMPVELAGLLQPVKIDTNELDEWESELYERGMLTPVSPLKLHTKTQKRSGEESPVSTSDVWPQQSWIVRTGDVQTVGVGQDVQGTWNVTVYPKGDGSVRLRLVPQINYGIPRPRIGVEEDNFLFKTSQSELKLDDLTVEVTILPGETVLVGATSDLKDLGRLFFRPRSRLKVDDYRLTAEDSADNVPELEQRVLMIRLVQTQLDELFGWNKHQSE